MASVPWLCKAVGGYLVVAAASRIRAATRNGIDRRWSESQRTVYDGRVSRQARTSKRIPALLRVGEKTA
jgi:hypothetical protein